MTEDYKYDFQNAIDNLDQRSLLLAMALLGKRAMDILQVHAELEKSNSTAPKVKGPKIK